MIGAAFPLEGWCVQVTAYDAAGNTSISALTTCDACMYAESESGVENPELLPIPGGPCDDGSSASTTGTSGTTDGSADASTTESTAAATDGPLPEPETDTGVASSDGSQASGPAQDERSLDRGCDCSSSAAPANLAWMLLLVGVPRRDARRRRAERDVSRRTRSRLCRT